MDKTIKLTPEQREEVNRLMERTVKDLQDALIDRATLQIEVNRLTRELAQLRAAPDETRWQIQSGIPGKSFTLDIDEDKKTITVLEVDGVGAPAADEAVVREAVRKAALELLGTTLAIHVRGDAIDDATVEDVSNDIMLVLRPFLRTPGVQAGEDTRRAQARLDWLLEHISVEELTRILPNLSGATIGTSIDAAMQPRKEPAT